VIHRTRQGMSAVTHQRRRAERLIGTSIIGLFCQHAGPTYVRHAPAISTWEEWKMDAEHMARAHRERARAGDDGERKRSAPSLAPIERPRSRVPDAARVSAVRPTGRGGPSIFLRYLLSLLPSLHGTTTTCRRKDIGACLHACALLHTLAAAK
jgi:hypothetical protein